MVPLPEDHTLSALAGIELHRQIYKDINGTAEGFAVENKDYMQVGAGTGVQKAGGGRDGYALASFFGKLDYNWKDLLLASFTIRRDGSSRFGENNKYGTFPAASLGYRLSKNLDKEWLSDLKVRASWGMTGNQEISNVARYGLYVADYGDNRDTGTAYDFVGTGSGTFQSGFHQTQQANRNLKWETTIQYNAGIDYGFLDNSIYGTIDAYIKDIEDMLISPAYLGALGEGGASWSNGPSLRNWGMEFTLGYRGETKFGLGYNISGNMDFYRNWVTYLPATTTGSYAHTSKENLVQAKVPYGSRVGYVVDGLFQSKEEVYASGQENARVGGLKYADLDGNGIINSDDQTWIFNPVPDFSYGLNIELNYKNFDIAMFWQGVAGQQIYNDQKYQTDFWSITDAGSNKGSNMLNAWTQDNKGSKIPALTTNNSADEGRASSYYVEDGSWLKLRSLQLGYSLPEELMKKAKIGSCRFYVSGQNILTLKSDSYTVSDPENSSWAYPQTTSVSVGVQLGF